MKVIGVLKLYQRRKGMNNLRKTYRVFVICAGISLASFSSIPVQAGDPLDDFRNAARSSGCNLIPYEDVRKKCFEENKPVKEFCKTKNAGCSSLDREKEEDRKEAKERKDNAIACIAAREQVREIYVDAVKKLEDAADHDDVPEIRSLAKDIISKINDEEEVKGHETAVEQAKNRRDRCEAVENNREY
jgi:hypothetical protein